ncbi:MAG TPA: hypothetical protein VMU68_00960 [Acidimicrobiales bacterium]|nr:hypothetical protein [Acidimicrobiales bacterium]
MDLFTLGNGSIHVNWIGVEGESGLEPRLVLKGKLVANGYALGALLQVSAKVTATEIEGTSALLGSTVPDFYTLNWEKNRPNMPGLPPADETPWDIRLPLPMSAEVIEGLETRRQGRDFWLQIDAQFVLVDKGEVHDGSPALMTSQTPIKVEQSDWLKVLERWERGVGITILLPLPEVDASPERAEIVKYLRDANQKIDGANYEGSIASSRMALDALREYGLLAGTYPSTPKERNVPQRIRAVVDALHGLASAAPHIDPVVKEYTPSRADAVAIVGATISVAHEAFALISES